MRPLFNSAELRHVLVLAAPIALMQTGMVLYGTVATVFAGRIGPEAIATVGLAGSTYFLLFIVVMGILLGIDPLSSQAFGAGRHQECSEVLAHAVVLGLAAVLPVFLALSGAASWFALVGIAPEIARGAAAYLNIMRWGLFSSVLFVSCRQYLQTLNVTRPQLAAVVGGNLLNAALDYSLMFGNWGAPRLGVIGAAYAFLAANAFMFLVVAAAAWGRVRHSRYRWTGLRMDVFRQLLRVGVPSGLQMLAEVGAFGLATMLCGRLGAMAAAAHQIVLNLASLSYMVPLGVSYAAAVRVGQGLGRGQPSAAARSGYAALFTGVAFMSLTSLAYVLMPRSILGLYTTDPAVTELGIRLLAVAAFFQVFDGAQVVLTGALRGTGETRIPMLANAVGYWAIGLPVGVFLAFPCGRGAWGLWIGLCIGLCSVALSLLFAWRRRARRLLELAQRGSD
ncbi:MAG: MATE family efflux transporter [Elusimicrobiota bacterium]|jgi:MATE family multidrug resistance protein